MYNRDILAKIIDEFDIDKATIFCEVVALMYDIKYTACKSEQCLTEYDYERDWWNKAYLELNKKINIE